VLLSRAVVVNSRTAGHTLMSGPLVFSNTSTYSRDDKQNLSDFFFFVNVPSTGKVSKPIFEL